MTSAGIANGIGIVVIGRNEGERLVRCLRSLQGRAEALVYVDSGSADFSVASARACGAETVRLDDAAPFTAARARNAGRDALRRVAPGLRWVQFIDGDCELVDGWLEAAREFVEERDELAVVCGRRRERHPERSVYNRLCDVEWDTPVGPARACGGDALMRLAAFDQAGGFRDGLVAGEEPELCVRLRALGWHVWRLDADMTWHDAAITRAAQWWRRCRRAGHAFAEGAQLHGGGPERHGVRQLRSALFWAGGLPAAALVAMLAAGPAAAALLLAYPMQVLRLVLRVRGPVRRRFERAFFLVAGKFPEALGIVAFYVQQARGRRMRLIEYK